MTKNITGHERFKFTLEWIRRGRPKTQEEFIKKCCETYGITYTSPPEYKNWRNTVITKEANMFPVKENTNE